MDIKSDWKRIREHFQVSFRNSLHYSIASVDSDNSPTVTPIGSLFLNDDQTGFYFEKYLSNLPRYAGINPKICVLAVNSSKWFWFQSLLKGKFSKYPAMKLYGELGEKRKATGTELLRFKRRMRMTKGLSGHDYLWGDMEDVRVVYFTKAEKVNLGTMTRDL